MTKLGVYLDLRNPPAWRRDWNQLYGFTLELCEEAERLGADSVWLSEHHGFEDGYLTQPLTFASAIAARTRRIRIGTAVVILPILRRQNEELSLRPQVRPKEPSPTPLPRSRTGRSCWGRASWSESATDCCSAT